MEIDVPGYTKGLMDAADFRLRELKGKLAVDIPHTVINATVSNGIREEAARRDADLVITGRGHAQASFYTLLSRLYPIVRESPCPVLSI
jgi:hypothetical protein